MVRIRHCTDLTWHRRFGSMGEFLDLCASDTDMPDYSRASIKPGDEEFRGTASVAEAVSQARHGWNDGAERVEKYAGKFSSMLLPAIRKKRMRPGIVGTSCNVGRYLAGDPECMRRLADSNMLGSGSKVVHIAVCISFPWRVQAEEISRRGAAIVAMIDAMEHMGYRCEVSAVQAGLEDTDTWCAEVPVKRADQHVDIDRLSFALASPAMSRRLMRSAIEHEPAHIRRRMDVGNAYGSAIDITGIGDIYLPAGDLSMFETDELVMEWLTDALSDYGAVIDADAVTVA